MRKAYLLKDEIPRSTPCATTALAKSSPVLPERRFTDTRPSESRFISSRKPVGLSQRGHHISAISRFAFFGLLSSHAARLPVPTDETFAVNGNAATPEPEEPCWRWALEA